MKDTLEQLIHDALKALKLDAPAGVQLERVREKKFGDFASNVAMMLAKSTGKNPRVLAQEIVAHLPVSTLVQKVEIAGPGFINFFVSEESKQTILQKILHEGPCFGASTVGVGQKIYLEYVSSNPTGPLHVGHGRSAVYGSTMASVLKNAGFDVHQEYYVNDAGRQMDIIATSIWLRYLELCGERFEFPASAYRGPYVVDIAKTLHERHGDDFKEIIDMGDAADPDKQIDTLIVKTKQVLGASHKTIFDAGLYTILEDMKNDMREFGVHHDEFFFESHFVTENRLKEGLEKLRKGGWLYTQDGAEFLKTTQFGDDKDRVVMKANGDHTYFATDLFYHAQKFEKDFTRIVDVFGTDHHGYVPRLKAGIQAMGYDVSKFNVELVQFVNLVRNGEPVKMSTRSGEFVTLRELREEVGNDAARFFYMMCRHDQHMEFDLELAKSNKKENPIYYIQYAHARICSVFQVKLSEKGFVYEQPIGLAHLSLLQEPHELALLTTLARYSEVLQKVVDDFEPFYLTDYCRDLANDLHTYYNAVRFLVEEAPLRQARLCLLAGVRQVLANGLHLLGIKPLEKM